MSLNKPSVELLMELVNRNQPANKKYTRETFRYNPPEYYVDPNHPKVNTRIAVAAVDDPMIRTHKFYPRAPLNLLGDTADNKFTVSKGATVADIIDEINARLGLAQTAFEFKPLEFFESRIYVLEPTAQHLVFIGGWALAITIEGEEPGEEPGEGGGGLDPEGPENPGIQARGAVIDDSFIGNVDDAPVAESDAEPAVAADTAEDVPVADAADADAEVASTDPEPTEEQLKAVRAYLDNPGQDTFAAYHVAFGIDAPVYSEADAEALLEALYARYPELAG